MRIELPYNVPSQNVTMRRHWAVNARERKNLTWHIIAECRAQGFTLPAPWIKSRVKITAHRKRRITDDANCVGGCKSLIDSLVKARVLVDDASKFCSITYAQELCGKREPFVIIEVESADGDQ